MEILTNPSDVLPRLWAAPYSAIDTETTNNYDDRSVIGTSRLFCGSVAWREGSDVRCAVFFPDQLGAYKEWLESPKAKKVGHNLWHYDSHVFANEGITLRGQHFDTLTGARLLDTNRDNGLKAWGKRLGFSMTSFKDLTARPGHSRIVRSYKRDAVRNGITYTAGAEYQTVNFNTTEKVPLDELWELYPQRREKILEYAAEDAVVHLVLYEHLVEELKLWTV